MYVIKRDGEKLKEGELFSIKIINDKVHLAEEKYDRKIVLSFLCGLYFVVFLALWCYALWSYKVILLAIVDFVIFVLLFVFLYKRQMSRGMN